MKTILTAVTILGLVSPAFAAVPVTASPNYDEAVSSQNPRLEANKKLVSEFWRTVLMANRVDEAGKFLAENYIDHSVINPYKGLAGFKKYFSKMARDPHPIPQRMRNVIAMVAEGDMVVLTTVLDMKDTKGRVYPTAFFDMFRIADDKIAEHWDSTRLPGSIPVLPFNNNGLIPKPK